MSTHIGAQPSEIAPRVLLPGDPLRAKWIAETFLDDPKLYSSVRNMYGFTGTYRGVPVSARYAGGTWQDLRHEYAYRCAAR